jgi:purine-binding chemotaxis protein CheW
MPEITPIPDAEECVEGVINLRGKIIPVVDLRKRFGQTEVAAMEKNRILVTEVENRRVGLIVDSASEVLKIPPADIDAPPTALQEAQANCVTGVAKLPGRLVILLDLFLLLKRTTNTSAAPTGAHNPGSSSEKSTKPGLSGKAQAGGSR